MPLLFASLWLQFKLTLYESMCTWIFDLSFCYRLSGFAISHRKISYGYKIKKLCLNFNESIIRISSYIQDFCYTLFCLIMDTLNYIGKLAINFNHAYDKLHQGPYKSTFIILNINFVTLIGNGFCPTEFSDFL